MFRKPNDASRKRGREKQPEKKRRKRREIKLLGGLAAGVIAGLVATWALDRYQEGSLEATRRAADGIQDQQIEDQQRADAEAAERIVRSTFGKRLSRTQRRNAAPVVHYAVGALTGGIYGLTAEILPIVRRGYGAGYANLLFLGGSEAVLPWFNLGRSKTLSSRAGGIPAPLVYGAVLETTRRVMRWML
jgi:hypothetical protein